MRCVSERTTKSFGTSSTRLARGGTCANHSQYTSAAQMSMADDAPPAMPRSEPFGMMHEHEPDPTYAASNHDARLYASAASAQHG